MIVEIEHIDDFLGTGFVGGAVGFSIVLDGKPEQIFHTLYSPKFKTLHTAEEAIEQALRLLVFRIEKRHRHKGGSKEHDHGIRLARMVHYQRETQGRHWHAFKVYEPDPDYFDLNQC